tara:strand:+ start:102 stop:671 length:570 start_codon:yes stop_codon:yes gene_type:complete
MKENLLRSMIRKQIKSSLNEFSSGDIRSTVSSTLGRVEKMAGVKMLKKALGQGTTQQQAAGLLQVIKAISGDDQQVARHLSKMLMKKGSIDTSSAGEADPTASVTEYTAGVDDSKTVEEKVSKSLQAKSAKVDKTQAMKMLKQALAVKSAQQQTDFVSDLIKKLELKDSAEKRLVQTLRKKLGTKTKEK